MLKKFALLSVLLVAPIAFVGCGAASKELEAETGADVEMDKEKEKTAMEESLEKMPPEQQKMMKEQMEKSNPGGGE